MIAEQSFAEKTHDRLPELLQLRFEDAVSYFASLDPFPFAELDGFYFGIPLDGGNAELAAAIQSNMRNENAGWGSWLGKAYRQLTPETGEGINLWRRHGQISHHMRFVSAPGVSIYDQKPCFRMNYGAYDHDCGNMGMVDELRRVTDNLYFGLAHINGSDGGRAFSGYFALVGPSQPYQVGPGEELVAEMPR